MEEEKLWTGDRGELSVEEELPEEETPAGYWLYELLRPMVTALAIMTVLLTAFTPIVSVSGESMRETLQDDDRILLLRPWLCGEIGHGDIVVVRQELFDKDPIIKRVIAVGGETVDIDFTLGVVSVDGVVLEEPYIRELTFLDEGVDFPLTVEEGHLFLLGDNRNNSTDSRYPDIGTVPLDRVIGKAAVLLFPGENAEGGGRDFSRMGLMN
ncbi:MAG: signal peptidase I [Oscillospiraceae bacterium]|nr:signal peptidase I [Oscillospiraceae bacterium]